jgi:flagellar M-ring protein FliF
VDPQQLLARVRSLRASLSVTQLASLAAAFVVVVAVVAGWAYWFNSRAYRVLFTDMDSESAAQVVERLRARDVEPQLADGGRTVKVPDDLVDRLRLELAGEGLPASGRIGFEIFDRTQFGATEFLEQVNYRRALEGEIARTIATIAEVSSARVHIVMPKDSLFGAGRQPAKASVIVKVRPPNRTLSAQTVVGISSLVAASVEGLGPEHVVVMDGFGRPLSRPAESVEAPLGSAEIERQQRFERDLAAQVVALLEPVVGVDRVRVNVAARLNPESEDRVEERWDPQTVVRSQAVTQDGGSASILAGGLAGARANVPGPVVPGSNTPQPPPVAAAALAGPVASAGPASRRSETTNYEVGKVVRHTVRPRGDVARLSVAVIVDDEHVTPAGPGTADGPAPRRPRTAGEMQKLHALVSAAVGLDVARGDQLTVENVSFEAPEGGADEPAGGWGRFGPHLVPAVRSLGLLVLGALAILLLARPLALRGLPARAATSEAGTFVERLPRTIAEIEGEIEARLDATATARLGDRRVPVLTRRLASLAEKEPENAAKLVRAWLADDRRMS